MRDVNLNEMRNNLIKNSEIYATNPNIKTFFDLVGNITQLKIKVEKNSLINFISGLNFTSDEMKDITEAIQKNTFDISKHANYTSYVYFAFSAFYQGLKHGLISSSNKQKNHLDFEYFLYMPFTNVICSDDKIFPDFFKVFSRQDQLFFNKVEILKEIELILEDEEIIKTLRFDSEISPEMFKSKTYKRWFQIYRPRENLVNLKSVEENKILGQNIFRDINESIDFETGKATNNEYQNRYVSLSLDEKFKFLIKEAARIFEIDNGWGHVKRNINADQIKDFYTIHADVWLPNPNISQLLPKTSNIFRGLYVGIVDLSDMNQILYMSLFFDELVIIDPFVSAWYMREKYNPISNPEMFKLDTLRNLCVYGELAHFVEIGKIKIIPMPFPIFSKSHKTSEEYAYQRIAGSEKYIYKDTKTEFDIRKQHIYATQLLSLPESFHRQRLMKMCQDISEDEFNATINNIMHMKRTHPAALEQEHDGNKMEQMITINSANLETIFLIASALNCIPITNSKVRANEISLIYGKDLGVISKIKDIFKGLEVLLIDNMELPGIYTMHLSQFFYKNSLFIRDICELIKTRNYNGISRNAKNKRLLNDLEGLIYIFDMFSSTIPQENDPNANTYYLQS